MEVLKQVAFWIVVTLVAGFIGYVGRYGAEWLIKRRRAQSAEEPMDKERAKVEKKRTKSAAKAAKKRNKG